MVNVTAKIGGTRLPNTSEKLYHLLKDPVSATETVCDHIPHCPAHLATPLGMKAAESLDHYLSPPSLMEPHS